MLQLDHRTLAPSATSVSISTAVCTVIRTEPAILAPASGSESPYWARMAISPGISCSARLIALRPNSAKDRSATRKSMGASLWEAVDIRRIFIHWQVRHSSQRPWRKTAPFSGWELRAAPVWRPEHDPDRRYPARDRAQ